MRGSGEGLALAISFTIAHTFCLAASITGPMLPEQSMQNTTSIFGLSVSGLTRASRAGSGAGATAGAAYAEQVSSSAPTTTETAFSRSVLIESSIMWRRRIGRVCLLKVPGECNHGGHGGPRRSRSGRRDEDGG